MATKVDIAETSLSASQVSELFRLAAIPSSHINRETFQAFLERRNPFEPKQVIPSPYPTYTVTVDGDLSLPEMIKAGGYDWVNDAVTPEWFPLTGTGKRETVIHLVHRNKVIESNDIITEMDALGYRPATIAELLALGAKYPELQQEFPIIALGSVAMVIGYQRVAYLDCWGRERKLCLSWSDFRWREFCRFAFVEKD